MSFQNLPFADFFRHHFIPAAGMGKVEGIPLWNYDKPATSFACIALWAKSPKGRDAVERYRYALKKTNKFCRLARMFTLQFQCKNALASLYRFTLDRKLRSKIKTAWNFYNAQQVSNEILSKTYRTMQTDNLIKQVAFIKEIDKLKYIQRKTKLFNSERHENDAEHSWHLAMMTIVLAEHSDKPIDVLKVLKMVLIHDIVEIDAGDTFIYDTTKNHTNTDEELMAANRIFGLLPAEQAEEFIAIWKEFEEGSTDEAKFAKTMDRFEPLLQNTSNNGGTWTEFNVPYQKVYDKKKAIKEGSTTIWQYAEQLINESVDKGILIKKVD